MKGDTNMIMLRGAFYISILITIMYVCKGCSEPAWSQTPYIGTVGQINVSKIADAIYLTENSKQWPYGIKHHYKHTTPRQACINTINHRLRLWNGHGDMIEWIGLVYSPPLINPNWVRLVHYFMERK